MKIRVRSTGNCEQCGRTTSAPTTMHCWTCELARRAARRRECAAKDCQHTAISQGICAKHHNQWRRGKFAHPDGIQPVAVKCYGDGDECQARAVALGLCSRHYQRLRKRGNPDAPLLRHGNGWLNEDGYRIVHRDGRDILEHRYLFEQVLGRPLRAEETVHHCNNQKADNRINGPVDERYRSGNLQLWSGSQPRGDRVVDLVEWAIELLELYAPDLLAEKPVQLRLA